MVTAKGRPRRISRKRSVYDWLNAYQKKCEREALRRRGVFESRILECAGRMTEQICILANGQTRMSKIFAGMILDEIYHGAEMIDAVVRVNGSVGRHLSEVLYVEVMVARIERFATELQMRGIESRLATLEQSGARRKRRS